MADAPRPPATPLRIAVMGASASVETSYHGGPRTDLGYPRVLEAELLAAGVPATVRVSAIPADRVRHGLAAWSDQILPWGPDVVVLHYGQADSVLFFLPRWMERHANSPRERPGRLRRSYRRLVVRPIWIGLAKVQMRVDRPVDPTVTARRQRRATAELARLLDVVRATSPALVLVPSLVRPGPPWQRWFPGAAGRMAALNRTFAEAVSRCADPNIRTFPLAELVEERTPPDEEPTPDGGHFTPAVHHLGGAAPAEENPGWERGPHHGAAGPPKAR